MLLTSVSYLIGQTICISIYTRAQTQIGVYNGVSLSLVFVPCIVAFIFLHVTIAQQLWQRRHQLRSMQKQRQRQQQQLRFEHPLDNRETTYAIISAFSVAAIFHASAAQMTQQPQQVRKLSPAAVARVARHRRMVRVVLLMMGAFICLRLPAWIFLMMRVYGTFSSPVSWIFYFFFGLLNLTSCALNPLFYTFLPQTLRVLSALKFGLCWLLCCGRASKLDSDSSMPKESAKHARPTLCCGMQVTWRCQMKAKQESAEARKPVAVIELPSTASSLSKDVFKDFNDERSLQTTASIKSSR